ncbi:zinc finger BED domain-containing protein 5-like [Metopolophium dirhodum]|uniref:zinc finger BED domain-containing protein 5-like n=1 Tax=Metopolophium dirhodum TaxID=44670 RepID=UPI00298FCD33|nr:zinc finger BED domain-containing protein 5-like [Metopolophium dirhodum]
MSLKVLAADSMIPNKLKRHFETNHGSLINKKRDYFVRQREQLEKQSTSFIKQTSVPTKALLASYKVAFRVAQSKKPHTIAEELILPSAIDMVSTMIGESAANQLKNIPLSNNTIKELLFCKPIFGDTKAQTLFDITNEFMNCNNINWENCLGVCTDGARAMAGHYGGLQALIRKKAPEMIWTHCIIHRESLASQNMCPSLNTVLQTVIKVVSYIKTRPVKARFFKKICEEMGAEHTALLFYCNSRWLSKGNVLIRVFELRQELYTYLSEEGHNDFNKFIDSKETNILQLYDKVVAFIKKIELWQRKLTEENGKTTCFSFLKSFLEDNDLELPMSSLNIISDHLMTLKNHFEKYFPEDIVQYNWIKDPFSENPLPNFTTTEEEQFIDISSDSSLRMKFSSFSLLEFWSSIKDEYSEISNKALRVLLPFATSYLCEAGFSAVAVLKSKYRSKLNIEKEMRVAVTTLLPNFEELLNRKQAHCSH